MKYKVIDEKLRIASCRIEDLTMQQVCGFLDQGERDAKIGSLTLFYDSRENLIVLNEDNGSFQEYLDITRGFLEADDEKRNKILMDAPVSLFETLLVIRNFVKSNLFNKWIGRAGMNELTSQDREMISQIPNNSLYTAYKLGVIKGKRHERAKSKNQQK